MSAALYIFRLVWPFLKELLLGGLSLREGMRTQKKKVLILFFVSMLILALFIIVPKFVILSQEHTKLEHSVTALNVKRLEDKIKELEQVKNPVHPVITPVLPDRLEPEPIIIPPIKPKVTPKRKRDIEVKQTPDSPNRRKEAYIDFFEQSHQ